MQKKSKLLFLLNSIFLCFTIPLFDIAFNNNDINKSLENPILNERQENHKKKQQNLIFSTYDSEEILDEDYQFTLPTKFGKFQESEYPSYYYPQEFESLDNVNTKEELNATRMGQIRIENEEILAETDAKIANNTLQKHNSADGQFFGKVEDTAKRIVKKVTINHNVSSRHSLGVFAPAGEILTVEIDEEIINKTDEKNRLTIIVGFPYRENTVHEVEKKYFQKWRDAKNRMPILFKEFVITNPVTKIGSPLGGMVFLKDIPGAIDEDFDIKISGGVNNPSYQYGVSSLSDWKDMLNSPSPYAIIQTPYLYFYAPKIYVNHIENPTNILYFWHNAAMLSNYAMGLDTLNNKIRPVILIFDSYVASGAALAYPGIFAAVCPASWISQALDYKSMLTSLDCWGTIHEFNHNFQYPLSRSLDKPWTVGSNFIEITNNVISVLSFIQYTDADSSRNDVASSGWSNTINPYYNLKTLLNVDKSKANFEALGSDKIYAYCDLIHSFGADKFIHFLRQIGGAEHSDYLTNNQVVTANGTDSNYTKTEDGFAYFASQYFGYDLSDYLMNVYHFSLKQETIDAIKNLNHPKYFSIQNVYALGEVGVETGKPYILNHEEESFTLDLKEKTISNADSFEITSITNMENGSYKLNADGTYTFTPNSSYEDMIFNLNYEAHFNDDQTTYHKTLKVHFKFAVDKTVNAKEYRVELSSCNKDVKKAIELFENDTYFEKKYVVKNLNTSVTNGVNLTHLSTKVFFNKDSEVTFIIYGDDYTLLKINDQEAICNEYTANLQTALNRKNNTLKIEVKAYEPIKIDAYCLNGGGIGNIVVQYSFDEINYQNIFAENCLSDTVSDDVINAQMEANQSPHVYETKYDLSENAVNRQYENGLNLTKRIQNVKCVNKSGIEIKGNANDHKIENLTDNNMSTWFTPKLSETYPLYYVFDFGVETAFSNINVTFYDSTYAPRLYNYYVSKDKTSYNKIYTRENNSYNTNFNDVFEIATGRYLILEIAESNSYNRTSIKEISFAQSLNKTDNLNIYNSSEEVFTYSNNWFEVKGNYINGKAKTSSDGKVSFILDGEDLLLYSLNKNQETNSYVTIDGVTYEINKENIANSPSLFVANLENKKHLVTIYADDLIFDAIKTSGTIQELYNLNEIELNIEDFIYDNKAYLPKLTFNSNELIEHQDYEIISCENNVEVGSVSFTIEGKGFFKGTYTSSFNINQKVLNNDNVTIDFEDNQTFTSKEITPEVTIKTVVNNKEVILIEDEDYKLTYQNNLNVGQGEISITFINNYQGEIKKTFNINAKKVDDGYKIEVADQVYDGTNLTPKANVTLTLNGKTITLVEGVDYEVEYENNVNSGTATIKIILKGNYHGELEQNFKIASQKVNNDDVKIIIDNQVYDGTSLTPNVKVTINFEGQEIVLEENKDFIITYEDNLNSGVAKVKITFINNYEGEINSTFNIEAKTLNDNDLTITLNNEQDYTGKEITPEIEIKIEENGQKITLVEGKDYEVNYVDNVEVGEGKLVINFKGNYQGTKTLTFNINKAKTNNLNNNLTITASICIGLVIVAAAATPIIIIKKRKKHN